jgi:hypothetical protein
MKEKSEPWVYKNTPHFKLDRTKLHSSRDGEVMSQRGD